MSVRPSAVTQTLVDMLVQRDAHGQKKYGTSLDREDLTEEQWIQHMLEELLDGAGYAVALKRVAQARQDRIIELSEVLLELDKLAQGWAGDPMRQPIHDPATRAAALMRKNCGADVLRLLEKLK